MSLLVRGTIIDRALLPMRTVTIIGGIVTVTRTAVTLEDGEPPEGAAFYRVEVSAP